MIHPISVLTILLMACATYATRTLGYAALANRDVSPRVRAVLDVAPGCVLVAVIAPAFVASRPADLAALAVTVLAAMRLPMMATVGVAIVAASLMRLLMG